MSLETILKELAVDRYLKLSNDLFSKVFLCLHFHCRKFIALLSQHASSVREKDLHADYLDVVNKQFTHYQYPTPTGDHSVESPFQQQLPSNWQTQDSYLNNNSPFHPGQEQSPLFNKPLPPGTLPVRPGLPVGFQPISFAYPQTSFVGALYSIATYDDLRCVPRLLCEVTSNGRKNDASKKGNKPFVPFLSRDAIVT